jgi:hypothetical protein
MEEGVYIFGGKNKLGKSNNKLIIMRVDSNTNKFLDWFYPFIQG